ncbi:uncharacterized protein N7515_004800 [Penicillium bovifimosum]|uniref:cyclin-dependent kinase n=1 Tax=Penicillium bovifimosum TaxID=126998 RepID=A0A9W9H0U2_9EURO|nr:uncharacterized protein N7515_004800 [Penicillium bovifimosum]KAJ5135522.1 hypothetical protein N7515_004800 [Penicillium bovifimosum]
MSWKDDFGFTDRLRVIQSLTTAYQKTSSTPTSAFADAMVKAKQIETQAYNQATTRDVYDLICQQAIDEAEAAGSAEPVPGSLEHAEDDFNEPENSIGEVIGQYASCHRHYSGLHSIIYRSKLPDGTIGALKVTIPHMMAAPHDVHREVRLLREASHAHIIPLIETFNLVGGRFVLVFPFVRYDFDRLLRQEMVTAAQTRSILRDMFRALAHLHGLGILHRDIKPSNILMESPNGPAYLADFGISWKEGDAGSEPPEQKITDVGSTCYRAPEILFGFKGYGEALDLWAAGCVVAEAISVGHHQLFDSGPVGSDLSLIFSIFKTMGTPDEQRWPEVRVLPDWGKVEFHSYPPRTWEDILPGASSNGRDLVSQLVRYESSERLSAAEALNHPYFAAT